MKPLLTLTICSAALLAGCATQSKAPQPVKDTNSVQALTTWDDAYGECIQQARTSQYAFPKDNQWFNSLKPAQKKNVVIYLYQDKMYGCSEQETLALKKALIKDGNDTLLKFFTSVNVFEKPNDQLVAGLDADKLADFAQKTPVFNISRAVSQLELK
ncbi:hypothetical protein [Vibrio porteresiae]|uniref:Lipoprotein n=1 Tax=Vibrio porteresiae DSM 19223 TaxID=1123496 RepID=A0ABZ0QGA8_9VIBR|nr:hypothetical protein [Vibrio porteresiae]WPC75454.1 hypothetical protein R8Z52_21230 [Vibrio porteresiae DSM 19223]